MWANATKATVDIALDGYAPYSRTFVVRTESPNVPVPPDQDRLEGIYVMLGDIKMKKREQDGSANKSPLIRSETNQTSSAASSGR